MRKISNKKEEWLKQSEERHRHEGPPPRRFPKEKGSLNVQREFRLGGLTIKTEIDDTLVEKYGMAAQSSYNEQRVTVDLEHADAEFTEQAVLHEVVHWILFIMNEDTLRNNERFVDLFAHFLYQYLKTAGWEIVRERRL